MKTVHQQMPPFKHEFYAIAVRTDGQGIVSTGHHTTDRTQVTLFFNSPYQIVQWDITPDWRGFYIIFSEDFYRQPGQHQRLTEVFPFLLIDNATPIDLRDGQANTFRDIHYEFHADLDRSREIIRSYVEVLLHKVARLFDEAAGDQKLTYRQRDNDLQLVSRFKTLIETSFYPGEKLSGYDPHRVHPHRVQYYADRLNVHPNHLNAVVKRITDQVASELIYQHMLSLAQSKLRHTTRSVKEIAFDLHYRYPNHFTSFFKKRTGQTPRAFRNKG